MRTKYAYLTTKELRALIVAKRNAGEILDADLVDEIINRLADSDGK